MNNLKMIWIHYENDAFLLNNICHICIQKSCNGYFLLGEMMHNKEEVVLSPYFQEREDCLKILKSILKVIHEGKND